MKKLVYIMSAIAIALSSCSKDSKDDSPAMPPLDPNKEKEPTPSELPQDPDFIIPNQVYNDNYVSYSGWGNLVTFFACSDQDR